MNNHDLTTAIVEQVASLRPGSLSFWGNWFGRPYDNNHRILHAHSIGAAVIIQFDRGETLVIDTPGDWSLEKGLLVVRRAKHLRFLWFDYGRLPSPETLHFEEYRRADDELSFATDLASRRLAKLSDNSAAVELHAFG